VKVLPLLMLRHTPPAEGSVAASTTRPLCSVVGTMLLITLPVKVLAARTSQLTPPSPDQTTPKPGLPARPKLLVLPEPANISSAFTGLSASDLMASAGNLSSVSGFHQANRAKGSLG